MGVGAQHVLGERAVLERRELKATRRADWAARFEPHQQGANAQKHQGQGPLPRPQLAHTRTGPPREHEGQQRDADEQQRKGSASEDQEVAKQGVPGSLGFRAITQASITA